MVRRLLFSVLPPMCALFLIACSGSSAWVDDADLQETLRETPPMQGTDAGAIVILDDGSMEITSGGEIGLSVFDRHRIVRILNPRGQRYANVVIPYSSSTHVDYIQARTMTPDGRMIPLREPDIFDVSLYPNFVFFSDQRAKIFTMPAVEDGAVIEYRYRIIITGRTFWPSWTFQDEVPVAVSRFALVKPGEWNVVYRSYGTPIEPSITPAPAGFKSRHVWEAREVPPLRAEFGMPPDPEVVTHIALAPVGFKSWDDIAHWYAEVVGSRIRGGDALRAMAESLAHDAQSDREKLERIFSWVRDQVRYIAVEIGVGGYEPHEADEIFAKRYGDCKDMVILLCSMAHAVGIDVRPVMISTWDNGRPDTTLPSPLQFNHLIGYAPGVGPEGVWLDATDKAGVFGTLPWYDQGVPVVVSGPAGKGYQTVTPQHGAGINRTIFEWNAELNADGSALISGSTTFTGACSLELRNELRVADSTDVRHWLETSLAHKCPGATLLGYVLPPLRPPRDTLIVSYKLLAPAFAVRRDSQLVVRPWAFDASPLADYFRSPQRAHPVRFKYPSETGLRMTVWAPLGWQSDGHSSTDSLTTSCGAGEWRINIERSAVRLHMTVQLQGHDLPPAEYPVLRDFLDGVRRREIQEIVLLRRH
jgi:transglutaminase-like putative cysteine protease